MITMEFEELKKIWNAQDNQPLYAINQKAMYNYVLSKKKKANHITNITELLLIFVNISSGIFILIVNYMKSSNVFMYVSAAWMFGSAAYALVSRVRRIKADKKFDRSISGDLENAISVATYQVRISQIMRWNVVPIAALTLLGLWEGGKPVWIAVTVFVFFALAFYASRWEHNIYKRKKHELEALQQKLTREM